MPLPLFRSLSLSDSPQAISTSDSPEISPSTVRMVRNLCSLLPSLSPLPESTLLKIWKGLFVCYWHSDKSRNQSDLAATISALISTNSPDFATAFLDAALLTLRREWGRIDPPRMDQFYLLVRTILKHTFLLLRSNSRDLDVLAEVMSIIDERALREVGGVRQFSYDVVEIFAEEINGFLPVNKKSLERLMKPFLTILEKSTDSFLIEKIKVNIFEKCLVNGVKYLRLKKTGREIEKGSEVDLFGIIGLIMGFSEKLLYFAMKKTTCADNKRDLHGLRARFFKLEMHLKRSQIEIKITAPEQIETFETGTEVAKIENSEGLSEKMTKKWKTNKNKKEKGKIKDEKNSEKKKKKKKKKIEKESISEKKKDEIIETELSNLLKPFQIAPDFLDDFNAGPEQVPWNTPQETKTKRKLFEMWEKNKRVRFSIENNVEWDPSTPLPPISLRLPPTAKPRGNAMKKGVPAGPVREMESPIATESLHISKPARPTREMDAPVATKRRRGMSKSARRELEDFQYFYMQVRKVSMRIKMENAKKNGESSCD